MKNTKILQIIPATGYNAWFKEGDTWESTPVICWALVEVSGEFGEGGEPYRIVDGVVLSVGLMELAEDLESFAEFLPIGEKPDDDMEVMTP